MSEKTYVVSNVGDKYVLSVDTYKKEFETMEEAMAELERLKAWKNEEREWK